MNLPNYFLADLPPQAVLTPMLLKDACLALKRNRASYLVRQTTESIVTFLSRLGRDWLDPEDPFRKLALELGPSATGFSRSTLANGLDLFFRQVTAENFHILLEQDLGEGRRLEEFTSINAEQKSSRAAIANAPEFIAHFAAGNLPTPAFSSIILGILCRSAQFLKCASGASLLPRLFAHSIYAAAPKLGACLEIAEWRGGDANLETVLLAEADCVTATGSDETLAAIRQRTPASAHFVGYGHRVSFAFITAGVLSGLNAAKVAARAAADVVAWNQLGCLSPHVIYVEHGGTQSPEQFAEALASELARCEEVDQRGELAIQEAATIASRRSVYELRAAHSPETRQWCSPASTAWTVVFEMDPRFQLSCLNRFIYVKGVRDLGQALEAADAVRGPIAAARHHPGAVGSDARLPARPDAEPAAGLAARWPSPAG
jgi:hypothetical protein